MDVPDWIAELRRRILARKRLEEIEIVVDRARDDVEMEALGRRRLAVHEQRETFGARVAQPILDRQAVALRLRDLLPALVEEQLVVEALRRAPVERAGNLPRQFDALDQVLARHLVIDAERDPAHRPIGLPLQLAAAARHRRRVGAAGRRVAPGDRAGGDVDALEGHLHDDPRLGMDRQEGRIARGPLLAEGGQHDGEHRIEPGENGPQRGVEAPAAIIIGRGGELVIEAEGIEEGTQARVVVGAETRVRAERVRHLRQRPAEMGCDELLVRDVVWHLAQPVHIVREGDETRRDPVAGQHAKGVAHHRRARDLAERADMRQAGGAVACLEEDVRLARPSDPRADLARFDERPGRGRLRRGEKRCRAAVGSGHGTCPGRRARPGDVVPCSRKSGDGRQSPEAAAREDVTPCSVLFQW